MIQEKDIQEDANLYSMNNINTWLAPLAFSFASLAASLAALTLFSFLMKSVWRAWCLPVRSVTSATNMSEDWVAESIWLEIWKGQ